MHALIRPETRLSDSSVDTAKKKEILLKLRVHKRPERAIDSSRNALPGSWASSVGNDLEVIPVGQDEIERLASGVTHCSIVPIAVTFLPPEVAAFLFSRSRKSFLSYDFVSSIVAHATIWSPALQCQPQRLYIIVSHYLHGSQSNNQKVGQLDRRSHSTRGRRETADQGRSRNCDYRRNKKTKSRSAIRPLS